MCVLFGGKGNLFGGILGHFLGMFPPNSLPFSVFRFLFLVTPELEHDFGTISFGDLQDTGMNLLIEDNSSSKTADTTNVPRLVKPDTEIGESLEKNCYIDDSAKRPCHDESATGNSIQNRKQDISCKTRDNDQRVAEYFAQESSGCSQLVKQGKPNVYLLNAE